MKRALAMITLLSCGPTPQGRDEATVTYRVKFTPEGPVNTLVAFPMPSGADKDTLMQVLAPSDGGTLSYVMRAEGLSCTLEALGGAEASWFVKNLKGFPESMGPPDVDLSMHQPDAGPGDLYLFMTKSGRAVVDVDFEYTATRDCGGGCGGKKSWTFTGSIGMGRQAVQMTYVEEKR